jgi:subtilisin family serine protease
LRPCIAFLAATLCLVGSLARPARAAAEQTEVVVALPAPALAVAVRTSRVLSARVKRARLDLRTPTSRSYLAELARAQRELERRIGAAIPSAQVRWRYRVVLDAIAVVLPARRVAALAQVPGVARVYPNVRYRASLDRSPGLIGADLLWGLPDLSTAGNGVKIGIIDDGIQASHPFFAPAGFAYPPGFPKGNRAYTTPKVIVARAFPPPSPTWKYAHLPFDPLHSEHGTHVAGIAAGNYSPGALNGSALLSGVAPRAYLGNYKALTIPTPQFGLDGNAAELAAAVEAAVTDGMDVINLSLGEPEIEPSRDLLVAALNGAAAAGVVPVVAAGNDFDSFGRGSITSPGTASAAITVAAVTKADVLAPFSASGPTPISLALKPDVSAPGVSILSSLPPRAGLFGTLSGTSMAAPHVAGAAALLRQRHPGWTVEQIKAALVLTADPAYVDLDRSREAAALRQGGGVIDLPRADQPLLFARPTGLAFGLVRPGSQATRVVELSDAGGGAGSWSAAVELDSPTAGVAVQAPPAVEVPGQVEVVAAVSPEAAEADVGGFLVLRRGDDVRRLPLWLRSAAPRLGPPSRLLRSPGVYAGDTRRGRARVRSYRYPDAPQGAGIAASLPGPEQVFRILLPRPVANVGVRLLTTAPGVRVSPRLVFAGDENRLTGYAGLPLDINPYRAAFGRPVAAVAAIAPRPGAYDVVFDTPAGGRPGPFSFLVWWNDTRPPRARLLTPRLRQGRGPLRLALDDAGSGVDPRSLEVRVDGRPLEAAYQPATGQAAVPLPPLRPGRHRLLVRVADFQETKNMETAGPILPNTLTFRATVTVLRR